jgi:hypothetical protein
LIKHLFIKNWLYKLLKNFKFEHVPLPLFFYRKHGKNLTKNQNKLYKTRTKILRKFSDKKRKIKDLNINCVIPVRGPNVDKFCNSLELLKKALSFRDKKEYLRYTGYPGGQRIDLASKLREKFPERIVLKAVKGMLPKGPLGYAMFKKLKVYAGESHPHTAQQPQELNI